MNTWKGKLLPRPPCVDVPYTRLITLCIPFRPIPIHVQLCFFSDVDELYQHYSEMIEHMMKVRQSEGKKMDSYNFLLFKKWLMIVPRTRVGVFMVGELTGNLEFDQCE